jgi:transposase-like protein
MRGVANPVRERELLMRQHEQGVSFSALSQLSGVCREQSSRWWRRYQQEGRTGLEPRSRRPRHCSEQLSSQVEQEILELRNRGWGPARIALALQIGHSSVHRVLLRHGRNRLRQPSRRMFRRYEKSRPGELLHLDLKYLYRWPNTSRNTLMRSSTHPGLNPKPRLLRAAHPRPRRVRVVLQLSAASFSSARFDARTTTPSLLSAAPGVTYVLG